MQMEALDGRVSEPSLFVRRSRGVGSHLQAKELQLWTGGFVPMRKRLLSAALAACLLVAILAASISYFRFASAKIYEESSHHLMEIYTQVNGAFHDMVSRKWKNVQMWVPYLSDIKDEDKVASYIQERQEQWGFTDFYFISHNGDYQTIDGDNGYLNLKEQLPKLILEQECVMADAAIPGSSELKIFAVPAAHGTFRGFEYEAVAVSYNNSDIVSSLDISAFGGQSDSYVIYSNGRVLIDNAGDTDRSVFNFLAYLESESEMSAQQIEDLRHKFLQRESGVTIFQTAEDSYYLVYAPVAFQDWVVLGVVPTGVVNASMNQLQKITMLVVIGITLALSAFLFVFLIRRNRQSLVEKDTEILYREKLFSTLSNNVDDIFIMLDADDYKVSYISPNVKRILGLSQEDICAQISEEHRLFQEKDFRSALKHLPEIMLGQRQEWEQEYINQQTGESGWFHILAFRTEIQGTERYVMVLSDRTRAREISQSLNNALAVAKSANEAKSNFLANISHDIRTPMNAIVGLCALLSRDVDNPEKVREYTRKISFSSQHLLGLINDVLDMSKIESGQTLLNITEFNMVDTIEEVYTIVLPQIKAKGQSIELHTRGNLPGKILGDKTRMNQILLNLLSNSVKYTPEGGKISLTLEGLKLNTRKRARIRFTVADNGYGMSRDFIKNIFDPFAREDTECKKEIRGTGLGMPITKNIVDLMGGTITVQSEPGRGSTFTVDLEFQTADEESVNSFWQHYGITRLLVADDDEDICKDIRTLMSDIGVDVSYATSGAEAVDLVCQAHERQEEFHIVILDWKMPGMDGVETARRIRAKVGQDIPILVLTAYDFSEIEEEAKEAGVDMFLPKPFFLSSFERVVAQYYEGKPVEMSSEIKEVSIQGLHVLAAEDNELNSEILAELLEMEGITCELVSNGKEALDRFRCSEPGEFDVILMDIQMPVMEGYEAARRIRTCGHPDAETIPIVAMTANAFEEDVQRALDAGMNAHMAKPVDMHGLKLILSDLKG